MSDQKDGAPCAYSLDRVGNQLGAQRVEVGGRLVEKHERRIAQEGPRQPEPAALARGQRAAAVADAASRALAAVPR